MFDLDGTLLDTLADLAASMNQALIELGYPTHPESAYRDMIGDGVAELARRALPFDSRDDGAVTATVVAMRENYEKSWASRTQAYAGVADLLDQLTARGLRLAILSNKPHHFTTRIVEHFLSRWTFLPVLGASPERPRKPDPTVALEIAEASKIDAARWIYVGDTVTDMRTALGAGMTAIGVGWGFQPAAQLEAAGARRVIRAPLDLLDVLAGIESETGSLLPARP